MSKITLVMREDRTWEIVSYSNPFKNAWFKLGRWVARTFPPGCIYEGPLPFGFYMGTPRNRK